MKIQFIKTGPDGMEPCHFRFQYARNLKLVFLIFYFFGVIVSWGGVDIVQIFRDQQARAAAPQINVPIPQNRAQRRKLGWVIKKLRHAQAS
jgi:hypothetical protein